MDDMQFDLGIETEVRCQKCGGTGRVWDQRIGADRMCECRTAKLAPPDVNPSAPAGIESRADEVRLNRQQADVWAVMCDGSWHTLSDLSVRTGHPEASVSARIRDLRKLKYGGREVDRRRVENAYEYRLLPAVE